MKSPAISEPLRGSVRLSSGQNVGVIPARVFGLVYTGHGEKPIRAYYFLEADRGTMPIQRQNPSQSSFHRKLLAYEATWRQNLQRPTSALTVSVSSPPPTPPAREKLIIKKASTGTCPG